MFLVFMILSGIVVGINCKSVILDKVPEVDVAAVKLNESVVVTNTPPSTLTTLQVGSSARKARARSNYYADFLSCAISRDMGCFMDAADRYLAEKRTDLLAEADQEASRALGRQDTQPSMLAKMISQMITKYSNFFKETFSSLMRTGKDDEETEEEKDEKATDDNKTEVEARQADAVEARKKKKDGKIHRLIKFIKLIILGAALAVKICVLVKLFTAALQFKFFLVAAGGLLLNAARFWIEYKKGHNPQKVIYYEHAQHQHHYEGGDEDWAHSSPGGGYWGRSYDEEENKKTAQDLAYSQQKPAGTTYSRVDNKPNYSWLD